MEDEDAREGTTSRDLSRVKEEDGPLFVRRALSISGIHTRDPSFPVESTSTKGRNGRRDGAKEGRSGNTGKCRAVEHQSRGTKREASEKRRRAQSGKERARVQVVRETRKRFIAGSLPQFFFSAV